LLLAAGSSKKEVSMEKPVYDRAMPEHIMLELEGTIQSIDDLCNLMTVLQVAAEELPIILSADRSEAGH
jgi:hypothetical protein